MGTRTVPYVYRAGSDDDYRSGPSGYKIEVLRLSWCIGTVRLLIIRLLIYKQGGAALVRYFKQEVRATSYARDLR